MTQKLDGSSIALAATMHGTHTRDAPPGSGAPHAFAFVPRFAAAGLLLLLGGCFTVNSLVDAPDESPGDGVCARALTPSDLRNGEPVNRCTLRAAVMEANASAWRPIITVPAATYHLDLPIASGGGRLVINRSMRIQGEGAATTIVDQTVSDGVIHIQGGSNVEINLLTAQGGDSPAGGGIRIDAGTVELEDLVVRNNNGFTGGGGIAISAGAVVRMRRSTVTQNTAVGAFGGGIWNQGELWVYDSTISNNDSNRAGGVRNSGNMNLRNVTVSGNTVHSRDAGVGGVSQSGFAVLNNVTITNNTGKGNNVGSFRGGGIQTSVGELTVMKNSIVAENIGAGGPDDCVGELTPDSKYNLIGSSTDCTITSFVATYLLDVPGDLGALASNGGPTQTHLPLGTSAARDSAYQFPPPAADACELRDQRGVPRPQGAGHCDMGAVEYTSASAFVTGFVLVNAASDTDIRPLRNDDVLVPGSLPPQLSIRAVTSGSPGSVVFGLDANPAFRTENAAPYSLGGDAAGDYAPVTLAAGSHTLTATPYSGAGGTAAAGGAMVVKFSVVGGR